MRGRRFFFFFLLSVVLWMGVACTQNALNSQSSSASSAVAPSPSPAVASAEPTTQSLPAETAAIVANVGTSGLYNPPRGQVRLVAISDLNDAYGSITYSPEVEKAMRLLPFWKPDMVVCSGDMVAGQDISLTQQQMQAMWAGFDQYVATPIRKAGLPFGFTVGNHDASSARGVGGKFLFQKEREITAEYWKNPKHSPRLEFVDRYEFPFYYTFKFKDIFFLTWDGSSSYIPPEKLKWVEKALSSPAARQAKLRILLGHLPLYGVAIGRDRPGEVMENADRLRAMLEKYQVHTYISGHQHAYYPGHKGKLQLLHAGLLGSGPRRLIDGNLPPRKTLTLIDINFNDPDLTVYTTFDIQTLKRIEYQELPRYLAGHNGMVLRRDVKESELSKAELTTCRQVWGRQACHA